MLLRTVPWAAALAACLTILLLVCAPPPAVSTAAGYSRWAYYVPDDPASLSSLQLRAGDLDYVALHWAGARADGSLEIKEDPDVLRLVRTLGARPVLSVSASGGSEALHSLLSSESSRTAAVENLARALTQYDGVSIDFEGLPPDDRGALTGFMAQLSARLRPAGKLVCMALSAKTSDLSTGWAGAHDYAALAPSADLFVLMAYGFRTAGSSQPGSTAPLPWVESVLTFAATQIPPEKLLLGVPLYGYDWDLTVGPPARALRYTDAIDLAARQGVQVQHDAAQRSAYFAYTVEGHDHQVWFEDSSCLEARLALVQKYRLGGVAAWRLGQEDPQAWSVLKAAGLPGNGAIGTAAPTGVAPPVATPTPASVSATASPVVATPGPTPSPAAGGEGSAEQRTWYFAEGSTASPFDTWFLLQNPGASPAVVRVTFMPESGGPVVRNMLVGPTSRSSIFANQVIPNAAFSTRIESDRPIFAERAMYAGFDGDAVTAISSPSRTWYFAEGSTASPFDTWILLQNPNPTVASARLIFQREDGSSSSQSLLVQPNSRASLFVNQVLPNASFSTRVESDQPVIAERAMYRFPGNAATGVTGVTVPSRSWYFGGAQPTLRDVPVDSWLLLQNPSTSSVGATITFFDTGGQVATVRRWLPPTSRQSIFVNQDFSTGRSFGIRVEATGEIIAERSVYLGATAASRGEPQGAYATQGADQLGTVWALPEGSTAAPFSEKIGVLNPHDSPMSVRFELMREDGEVVVHEETVPPARSFDLDVGSVVPSAGVSARVITSLPSAVERTMFWTKDGKIGVHNTVGIRLQ